MDSNLPNNETIDAPVDVAPAVKKKGSKAPVLAATLFGVLAVAGIGFGVYSFLDSNKKGSEISDLKAEIASLKASQKGTVEDKKPTVEPDTDIFEEKDEDVRSLITTLNKLAKKTTGVAAKDSTDYAFPTYFDGLKTATTLEKNYGFEYGASDIELDMAGTLSDALVEKLEDEGFVEFEKAQTYPAGPSYINEDTGITCYVGGGLPFGVACGYYKWVSDETVELVNELADAYKDSEGKYPRYLGVYADDDYKITDSEVSPYQKLMARFEDAAALFYRSSKTADWKYFTGTQAVLSCSDYNTKELKNAYSGEVCYDEDAGKNSTVQP